MAHDIPKDTAHLIGFTLGLLMYGFYVCLFALTMWILHVHNYKSKIVTGVMVSLFVISTVQISLCIADNYNAWIRYRENPGPIAYFFGLENVIMPTKDLFLYLGSVVADSLICWRLYVIWQQKKWILIAPLILMTFGTVSGAIVVSFEYLTVTTDSAQYRNTIDLWTYMAFCSTVLVNLTATCLISGRLWYVGRQITSLTARKESAYRRVIHSLIESGALYTVTMLTFIVIFASGRTAAQYMASYVVPMIVAIVPTLIVLRLNVTRELGGETTVAANIRTVTTGDYTTKTKSTLTSAEAESNLQVRISIQQTSAVDAGDVPIQLRTKPLKQSSRPSSARTNSSSMASRSILRTHKSSHSLESDLMSSDEEPEIKVIGSSGVVLPTLAVTPAESSDRSSDGSGMYETRAGTGVHVVDWKEEDRSFGHADHDLEMGPVPPPKPYFNTMDR